ncbi:MAG: lysostaphin resistance A-like protein [Arenimonas sp.]
MLSNDESFAKKSEAEKTTPRYFSVLGVVVLDIGLLLLVWFMAMIVATAFWTLGEYLSNAGHISPKAEPGATAQLLISLLGLYFAVMVLSFWRTRKLHFPPEQISTRKMVLLGISTGALLFLLTLAITNALEYAGLGSKPSNQALLEDFSKQSPIAVVLFTVVLAPIFEELLFRKLLFARLAQANHLITAYLLSGLLFALMHEPSPTNGGADWLLKLLIYGFMGAIFAWVYKKTGNLWPAILAHASNNLFGILTLFLFA